MGIVKYNPTSPGRRGMSGSDYAEVTEQKPFKKLTVGKKKISGRNAYGRITVRHRGGGNKNKYRIIDFKRENFGVPGVVKTVEYDPNRNTRICLVNFINGDKRYVLHAKGISVGSTIVSGKDAPINVGNTLPLSAIPVGTQIHNVEMKPGKGGQLARSAGASVLLMSKEEKYAQVKLKSGEIRLIPINCLGTLGEVGNSEFSLIKIGKAGRKRWKGIRPTVRGVAMNPVDHPHGGGEGRGKGGNVMRSPTGVPSKGYKTRSNKRTDAFILKRIN